MSRSGHLDHFVRDHLPPVSQWPEFLFDRPEYQVSERANAAEILRQAAARYPDRPALFYGQEVWTYRQLWARVQQVAQLLAGDMRLTPGNRVLLHGPTTPMMVASWWAILAAGGVAVTTMPMLRAGEIGALVEAATITHALADVGTQEEVERARDAIGGLASIRWFNDPTGQFVAALDRQMSGFRPVDTHRDDPALIAFTSGTTGKPKGCVHFHRDVMVMPNAFSRHMLAPTETDIFCGTPPIAFTFGLGGLVVFPAAVGAATALPVGGGYEGLQDAIADHRATILFSAPTGYRGLLKAPADERLASLRLCVSGGEPLDAATSDHWLGRTGIRLIDGIGATEMLHIFISARGADIRPGSTGKPVPGYRAVVLDDENRPLPPGSTGRLAVRGPTGCRYLADPRQSKYVIDGWNVTGDLYHLDEEGYFSFRSRVDDLIVSSGYNIAAAEVEAAILRHPAIAEAAVVGVPDGARGQIVKAFIVLHDGANANPEFAGALQDFVKQTIAPYKYPRAIEFVTELPKTPTGKLQRSRLRAP